MGDVVFVGHNEEVLHSDVQIDNFSRVEIAKEFPKNDRTDVVYC